MEYDQALREHLLVNLDNSQAHVEFDQVIRDFPFELSGKVIESVHHSAWDLVYHLWVCQHDIIEYVHDPQNHVSPFYPSGLWPDSHVPVSEDLWNKTISGYHKDMELFRETIKSPDVDLLAPLPHTEGHTLMREALIIGRHASYHIAQLVDLRMLLGIPVRDW